MAFGDPSQSGHMRAGVLAALKSPKTPAQLRPHLAARAQGTGPAPNPLGNPMQMAAQALKGAQMNPIKTIVPMRSVKPVKTMVGSLAGAPRKTVVGNLAAAPRKATPGSFGGGNGPLPLGLGGPTKGGAVAKAPRNPIGSDGNMGKSTSPMPPPAGGPPNPVLDGAFPTPKIVSGGMGQSSKLSAKERGAIFSKGRASGRGAFFGA